MPMDFTVCTSWMTPVWYTQWAAAEQFALRDKDGDRWAYVYIWAADGFLEVEAIFGNVWFIVMKDGELFPRTWVHTCVSYDSVSGMVVLVIDGVVLKETVFKEVFEEDLWRPVDLKIALGGEEDTGIVSGVNMWSTPLPTARLIAMTTAGGKECGAPGDLVNWAEAEWNLTSQARVEMVEELDAPCRRESEVVVYTNKDFKHHETCMEHCEKIGKGRSPPVRTPEEWEWLRKEVHAVTTNIALLRSSIWVAATDEEKEGEWKDPYTGEKLWATPWARPWFEDTNDTTLGDVYNCLRWITTENDPSCWDEWECGSYDMSCVCQSSQQPILRLRGLCWDNAQDTQYIPKQFASNPTEQILVGNIRSQIRYNESTAQWVLTDLLASMTAVCDAPAISYALGKHEWTITNDVFLCNKGQPYTALLKLTGCNPEGDFTCDDGQCVTMAQRCNQIPNCRDKSDEVNCHLLILENNYNMKVPPIVPTEGDAFNPAEVGISISILKIVSMEEVQHKIDLQFEITLEWRENRASYHNLKEKTSLNALTKAEIEVIWLPYVIYANTDMKEAVQLWDGLDTTIVVNREANFTRAWEDVVDETEVFEGNENRLLMYQSYTKSFQCLYKLQKYPFDKQVGGFTRNH